MRFFGKTFGGGRAHAAALAQARSAELRGELAQAAALFAQAGRLDEAARVMVLRGDAETEPAARLRHYVQAVETAPDDSPARALARKKRANLVLAMAADAPGALGPALRQDVATAARELEELGDFPRAAEAYALAGEVDGEAHALARAGEVDKLDALLLAQQGRDREALARRQAHEELGMLVASGRRREAAAMARAAADDALRERGRSLEARRVSGDVLRVAIRKCEMVLVLGEEVVVGRVGTIAIASAAVSRQHVAVSRRDGEIVVRDLGSRNGTMLRGLALAGEARVGEGLELRLGNEVPLVVRAASELAGAVAIEIAGTRYVAPLGPAALGVGRWRLERADEWIELVTGDAPPAFAGSLRLSERVALLAGDVIAAERSGEPALEVRDGGR